MSDSKIKSAFVNCHFFLILVKTNSKNMKPTFLAIVVLAIASMQGKAQVKGDLNAQDGISVSYELTKQSEGDKKDKYILVVTAINTNDYDLFYTVPMMKQPDGQYKLNSFENKSFCEASCSNSTGLMSVLGDKAKLSGQETSFITKNNEIIFKIGKGQRITADAKFTVKPGQQPIITNSFRGALRKLDQFDIGMNAQFINGTWVGNCGNIPMGLSYSKSPTGQNQVTQIINGRQQVWLMVSENVFEKPNDKTATLTYNKAGNVFTYTHTDGVICIWSKK
jgi:hypothetical protein